MPPKSWKTELLVKGNWSTNSCRYATKEEAEEAGREIMSRWFVPEESRATETDDEVNYRFDMDEYRPKPVLAAMVEATKDGI